MLLTNIITTNVTTLQRLDDETPQYSKEAFQFETLKAFISMNVPFRCVDNKQLKKLFRILRPTVDCPSTEKLCKDLGIEA
jgi:hypothetical protein